MPEQEGGGNTSSEPQHTELVQQTNAEDHAEHQPSACRRTIERADENVGRHCPEQDFENVHRVETGGADQHWRDRRRSHRNGFGNFAAIEAPRDSSGEPHRQGSRDRSERSEDEERIAERGRHQREECHAEGWMVDVSPGEVPRAGEVIELVAKIRVGDRIGKRTAKTSAGMTARLVSGRPRSPRTVAPRS